ncbi:MAG TPA: heavy metal-binding domain-containing protein [Blastocatellia bacterium]|nr:heavy metal-binding domain-containing protein [Blastocatellia bacterium]
MRAIGLVILSFVISPVFLCNASSAFQDSTVYTCPMHPEVQSSKPGACPKCEMRLVAAKPSSGKTAATGSKDGAAARPSQSGEAVAGAETFTCSMHPEIRAGAPGKCPRCGMSLVPVSPAIADEFNLRMEASPKAPRPNERVRLMFTVSNPKTGERVKQFQVMHDKLYHLFVVSQDMSEFQHIHPEHEPDGSFTIETVLPRAGQYKIYSDFYPADGAPQVLQQNLMTAGYKSDLVSSLPQLTPDTSLVKVVDGMRIELQVEPSRIISGRPATLKYHLADVKTGEAVRDLAPYLGAWGHTLILSEDQSDYVHSHPEEAVPEAADRAKLRGGPEVTFGAFLPHPGNYRIWTQFLRGEAITTVSFTVRAERLR